MRIRRWFVVALVVALLSSEMNVYAASDVGEVSSYVCDMDFYFQLDDYTTHYKKEIAKNVPTKRIVRENWSNSNGFSSTNRIYKYNAKGEIASVTQLEQDYDSSQYKNKTIYKYDKNGYLKKKILKTAGKVSSWTNYETDSDGKIIKEYYYNDDGKYGHSVMTYSKGRVVKQNSVLPGGKVVIKYKYNSDGNMIEMKGKGGVTYKSVFAYDADGKLVSVNFIRNNSSGRNCQFTYDNDNYLSRITNIGSNGIDQYHDFVYETVSPTHKKK